MQPSWNLAAGKAALCWCVEQNRFDLPGSVFEGTVKEGWMPLSLETGEIKRVGGVCSATHTPLSDTALVCCCPGSSSFVLAATKVNQDSSSQTSH